MKKMKKRVIAFLLSVLLVAGGSVSVFAEETAAADDVVIVETADETPEETPEDIPAEPDAPETEKADAPEEDALLSFDAVMDSPTLPGGEKPVEELTAENVVETLGADKEVTIGTLSTGTGEGQIIENDGIEVHLFNYGAAINSKSTIYNGTNGNGYLPFSQAAYEYLSTNAYTYKDGSNTKKAFEDMSEVDGEASGNSSTPTMSKTLVNGYPHIAEANGTANGATTIEAGSLKYLFDKDSSFVKGNGGLTKYEDLKSVWDDATKLSEANSTSNTGYTPNNAYSYQSMHYAVKDGDSRLFKKSGDYYVYYSQENAAWYNPQTQQFVVYDQTVVPAYNAAKSGNGSGHTGNFLPFNEITTNTVNSVNQMLDTWKNDTSVTSTWGAEGNQDATVYLEHTNHTNRTDLWFGLSVEFDFYMPENGLINETPMIYEFYGDDDVWVYIDGVLVLDIGGCHASLLGKFDLSTGEVEYHNNNTIETINGVSTNVGVTTTLKAIFEDAYESLSADEKNSEQGRKIKDIIDNGFVQNENGQWIFKDFTSHNFQFYYLERGGNISGMQMKFNIDPLPKGALTVEKTTSNINNAFDIVEYEFEITGNDGDGNNISQFSYKLAGNVSDEQKDTVFTTIDGKFVLKSGQMAIFTNINAGDIVSIKELSSGGYTTTHSISGDTETSGENETISLEFEKSDSEYSVVFLNNWNSAPLEVVKRINGNEPNNVAPYEFHVNFTFNGQNIPLTFTLSKGETYTISGIPLGTPFTITESVPTGGVTYMTPTITGASQDGWSASGIITSGDNTVTYTNRCYVSLTIEKSGNQDTNQSFVFDVTGDGGYAMRVVIVGDGTVTISDMPVGTYTVTEVEDWSWRYEATDWSGTGVSPAVTNNPTTATASTTVNMTTGDGSVTFTNSRTESKWLSGDCYAENAWSADGADVDCGTAGADVTDSETTAASLYYYFTDPKRVCAI